jgi:hypothetical protein
LWNCNSDANSYSYSYSYSYANCDSNCHSERNSHTHGDSNTAVRRKMQSDAEASSDSCASPVVPVVASLCEAQT